MSFPYEVFLFVALIWMAFVIKQQRDLFSAAMLGGVFSLLSAALFTLMDAVDVAFTEAAVGAGMSTVLVLSAISLTGATERRHQRRWARDIIPIATIVVTGAALLYGTLDMPHYGDPSAPIHDGVGRYYLERSAEEVQLPNVVTSVLASYRGFDTFGELAVVFTAAVGVSLLLARRPGQELPRGDALAPATSSASSEMRPVRLLPVLRTFTKALIPVVLLFGLYVQAHGDFGPGGGFQAGVIFGSGLMLHAMIYGPDALEKVAPLDAIDKALAMGLLIYGGTGVLTMALGGAFLDYGVLSPGDPVHGQHLGIFTVELGVGVTVTAAMLTIYFRFMRREAR